MSDLDDIDRRLLAELQADARLPAARLAERIGLSPSACLRRIRRLEEIGVIAGWHVRLDPVAVGHDLDVFVEISLRGQSDEDLDAFEQAVADCPGLRSCHLVAGETDYLLRLSVGSVAEFERIHRQRLSGLPGVSRMASRFTLRTVLENPGVDLGAGRAVSPGARGRSGGTGR